MTYCRCFNIILKQWYNITQKYDFNSFILATVIIFSSVNPRWRVAWRWITKGIPCFSIVVLLIDISREFFFHVYNSPACPFKTVCFLSHLQLQITNLILNFLHIFAFEISYHYTGLLVLCDVAISHINKI